ANDDRELWFVQVGHAVRCWRFGERDTTGLCRLQGDPGQQEAIQKGLWKRGKVRNPHALQIPDARPGPSFVTDRDSSPQSTVYVWQLPGGALANHFSLTLRSQKWPRIAVNADGSRLAMLSGSKSLHIMDETQTDFSRLENQVGPLVRSRDTTSTTRLTKT